LDGKPNTKGPSTHLVVKGGGGGRRQVTDGGNENIYERLFHLGDSRVNPGQKDRKGHSRAMATPLKKSEKNTKGKKETEPLPERELKYFDDNGREEWGGESKRPGGREERKKTRRRKRRETHPSTRKKLLQRRKKG